MMIVKPLMPTASTEQGLHCLPSIVILSFHDNGFVAVCTHPLPKEVEMVRFINSSTRIFQMPDLYSLL